MARRLARILEDLRVPDVDAQIQALTAINRLGAAEADEQEQLERLESTVEIATESAHPDVVYLARKALNKIAGLRETGPSERAGHRFGPDQDAVDISKALAEIRSGALEAERDDILPCLRHSDARVRSNAVEVLDGMLGDELAPFLLPIIRDENHRVRSVVLLALARRRHPQVRVNLQRMVDDESLAMREAAVWALAELRDPAWLELLEQASHDESGEVRVRAARALADMASPEADEALRKLAGDDDPRVQEVVAGRLGADAVTAAAPADTAEAAADISGLDELDDLLSDAPAGPSLSSSPGTTEPEAAPAEAPPPPAPPPVPDLPDLEPMEGDPLPDLPDLEPMEGDPLPDLPDLEPMEGDPVPAPPPGIEDLEPPLAPEPIGEGMPELEGLSFAGIDGVSAESEPPPEAAEEAPSADEPKRPGTGGYVAAINIGGAEGDEPSRPPTSAGGGTPDEVLDRQTLDALFADSAPPRAPSPDGIEPLLEPLELDDDLLGPTPGEPAPAPPPEPEPLPEPIPDPTPLSEPEPLAELEPLSASEPPPPSGIPVASDPPTFSSEPPPPEPPPVPPAPDPPPAAMEPELPAEFDDPFADSSDDPFAAFQAEDDDDPFLALGGDDDFVPVDPVDADPPASEPPIKSLLSGPPAPPEEDDPAPPPPPPPPGPPEPMEAGEAILVERGASLQFEIEKDAQEFGGVQEAEEGREARTPEPPEVPDIPGMDEDDFEEEGSGDMDALLALLDDEEEGEPTAGVVQGVAPPALAPPPAAPPPAAPPPAAPPPAAAPPAAAPPPAAPAPPVAAPPAAAPPPAAPPAAPPPAAPPPAAAPPAAAPAPASPSRPPPEPVAEAAPSTPAYIEFLADLAEDYHAQARKARAKALLFHVGAESLYRLRGKELGDATLMESLDELAALEQLVQNLLGKIERIQAEDPAQAAQLAKGLSVYREQLPDAMIRFGRKVVDTVRNGQPLPGTNTPQVKELLILLDKAAKRRKQKP